MTLRSRKLLHVIEILEKEKAELIKHNEHLKKRIRGLHTQIRDLRDTIEMLKKGPEPRSPKVEELEKRLRRAEYELQEARRSQRRRFYYR